MVKNSVVFPATGKCDDELVFPAIVIDSTGFGIYYFCPFVRSSQ